MGVTFAMFLWARDHARRWTWPLLVYTGVMGVALVYMAEHYVADLVVGVACATLCWLVSRRAFAAATTTRKGQALETVAPLSPRSRAE
jgi:membrane-associated phospholipid phosphatase